MSVNTRKTSLAFMCPLIIAASLILFATGCTSTKPVVKIESPPKSIVYHETIKLDESAIVDLGKVGVPDDNKPEQVIQFAISLSNDGRHGRAANFLEEAATKYSSKNNELAIACRAAAANEYLLAGDMVSFRTCIRRLPELANSFQAASFNQNILTLLCLGEIANGEVQPADKELTPKSIRELYPAFSNAGTTGR